MPRRTRRAARIAAGAVAIGILTSCGGGGVPAGTTGSGDAPQAGAAAPGLGTPDRATGEPILLGLLNQEAGPVAFPEVSAAARAAVAYVNEYRGGIGGRPIELADCVTDGQPSTSERCANQVLDRDPVAVLGGIDTGAGAALQVWERSNLAFLGGLPLTPAENTSPNSIQFYSASIGDNAAAAVYAARTLGARKAMVVYTDDPQGQSIAERTIIPTLTNAGVPAVEKIAVPPSSADLSAQAAAAVAAQPDVIFVVTPNACANMMTSLQAVGNTARLFTIGPCMDPRVNEAAGTAMEGVLIASPFEEINPADSDAAIFLGAMAKYAPPDTPFSPLAVGGFGTVLNVEAVLDALPADQLTTEGILAAFRATNDQPNFMAHPYTCNGQQLGPLTAVCNPYELIYELRDGAEVPVDGQWFSPAEFYRG